MKAKWKGRCCSMFQISEDWSDYDLAIIKNQFGAMDFDITAFVRDAVNLIPRHGKILDLGCGAGRNTFYLGRMGFKLYASDLDCRKIRENGARLGCTDICIREHSFTSIPYPDCFFDAVCCMSTLHHAVIREIRQGIDEVYRIIKPGGLFLFDFLSVYDGSFGLGREIEKNTFVGSREGEEGVAHHYTDEEEIRRLTAKFSDVKAGKSIYHYQWHQSDCFEKVFDVTAIK